MTKDKPAVWRADWSAEQDVICTIRRKVFIEEQQVPEDMEWDGLDASALHVLGGFEGTPPCGTARLLPDGRIGRMAVLPEYRNRGLGSALLLELMDAAADVEAKELSLHAQIRAVPFYVRHGFEAVGEEFEEAGILHRRMQFRVRQ